VIILILFIQLFIQCLKIVTATSIQVRIYPPYMDIVQSHSALYNICSWSSIVKQPKNEFVSSAVSVWCMTHNVTLRQILSDFFYMHISHIKRIRHTRIDLSPIQKCATGRSSQYFIRTSFHSWGFTSDLSLDWILIVGIWFVTSRGVLCCDSL